MHQKPEEHPSSLNSCTFDPSSRASLLLFNQLIPHTLLCPVLKAQQPCLTRSACSLPPPAETAELSSNQSVIYVPPGPPHIANLFAELVIDKLRPSPFFPLHSHSSFPARAASLFLHHSSQKSLSSCCWSLHSVFLHFWGRVLRGITYIWRNTTMNQTH